MSNPHPIDRLAPSYAAARAAFLDAADAAGASVESFPHPLAGREGEELAVDTAVLGDVDADAALVIVSGTHGVEGYAGSALQRRLLVERGAELASTGLRVVFVHALNPYGFSWVRRVNEDNVDLNRNFIDWSSAAPTNDGYGEMADLLVPAQWDEATQQSSTLELLGFVERLGMEQMQAAVSSGQYDHPTGVFHGGSGPVWSHRWLRDHDAALVGGAARIGIIDLHTGLGPWSHGELISHAGVGDPGYERGTAWWGEVMSMRDGESVSADLSGDWLGAIDELLAGRDVTSAALEFGTVDPITVLQSLRADAWLHAHGDATSAEGDEIRRQVWNAFLDDDPEWLAALVARCDEVVTGAVSGLAT